MSGHWPGRRGAVVGTVLVDGGEMPVSAGATVIAPGGISVEALPDPD